MTNRLPKGLAGAILARVVVATSAAAEPRQPSTPGLDCRFLDSQAFNQGPEHYTAAMARMCRLLSDYKQAIVANAMARYEEGRSARIRPGERVTRGRVARLSGTNDVGNYLIAREIGLIEALAAVQTPQ
ncbi:MAG: hypothetical protein ACFBWO_12560 [Paracoccaceae bacterium]